jgi:hypothetical protein
MVVIPVQPVSGHIPDLLQAVDTYIGKLKTELLTSVRAGQKVRLQ